ncbi:MAG: NAD(P)H-dependent oxidoreductase subunit E [Pseudomonadales bacterium]|nr:NAD(P)H-dependent oxidoreductase subunit E [Gammaproteobacteria bacterium]MBP6050567.1 NAD(P)H-dependent oxidoreductase subunit E [Pseudomonadales bacterium]MBK6583415.1 NAD(P)H-dependent oxidoreductase subunit E [Gammaproteobacteria bacterium]MBK7521122.1 NAD(P)H-dependent oxidoreductase subunit E [Gammaproteobacteria bacterium]MBK8306810.1 NAD(P)H-dependent oxidoreductase subunit E [Gammaproteobacteria bacterium]
MPDARPPPDAAIRECVDAALREFRGVPGALLPVLQAVQEALGHVPPQAVAPIAEALNLSRAEIHGVLSFYHDLRTVPGARRRLQLCRAEACQASGARALEAAARQQLGIAPGEITADAAWSLEAVYCLGNCACGPCVRIDDAIYGRVDAQRLALLLGATTARPGA